MRSLVLGSVLAVALAGAAQAGPIKWTLQDVSAGGSTLTGSFSYDADTNVYSNFSVEISGGSLLVNATYTNPFVDSNNLVIVATTVAQPDLTGLPVIAITFDAPLTDAGGEVGVFVVGTDTCPDAGCHAAIPDLSASGSVVAEVPEPASLAVLGFAALGLAATRWVRRQVASITA